MLVSAESTILSHTFAERLAFFLVTFSLAKQEKVTSCRATPGGFNIQGQTTNILRDHNSPTAYYH